MNEQSENQALYRKYRPTSFSEVVGQDHIVSVLRKALKERSTTHAYLFYGGRGTGKTSVARLLAKELGTSSKDLYEMDAASNRKIDHFRELNESVHTLPFESKYKVYIIDEVHMLTKDAFNAFLKTLEEPPKHVVFILATTELEKLPDTIVSRCQTFPFNIPSREILADVMKKIAKKEKYTLDTDAAELIALLAEGSFRDGLGILQKVLSYSDDTKISLRVVEEITGSPRSESLNSVLSALCEKDTDTALRELNSAVEAQIDIDVFQKLLLDRVRAVLLLKHSASMADMLKEKFNKDDYALIEKVASTEGANINAKILKELLDAYLFTSGSYTKQIPLEMAILNICK